MCLSPSFIKIFLHIADIVILSKIVIGFNSSISHILVCDVHTLNCPQSCFFFSEVSIFTNIFFLQSIFYVPLNSYKIYNNGNVTKPVWFILAIENICVDECKKARNEKDKKGNSLLTSGLLTFFFFFFLLLRRSRFQYQGPLCAGSAFGEK